MPSGTRARHRAARNREVYTHGHHDSVLRSHRSVPAENSAAYLLGSLRRGQSVLDIGCGPGTITADLATRVHPGRVVGLDRAPEVVAEAARNFPETSARALSFVTGDVTRPPRRLLRRGARPPGVATPHRAHRHAPRDAAGVASGGVLAVRDSDYAGFVWAPDDDVLDRWLALYHAVTAANGAEADAGRHLPAWVRAAGFDDMTVTSSTWTFADPKARAWWGQLWAERVVHSGLGQQALAYGLADADELAAMAAAWGRWAESPDGFFAVLHVEVVAASVSAAPADPDNGPPPSRPRGRPCRTGDRAERPRPSSPRVAGGVGRGGGGGVRRRGRPPPSGRTRPRDRLPEPALAAGAVVARRLGGRGPVLLLLHAGAAPPASRRRGPRDAPGHAEPGRGRHRRHQPRARRDGPRQWLAREPVPPEGHAHAPGPVGGARRRLRRHRVDPLPVARRGGDRRLDGGVGLLGLLRGPRDRRGCVAVAPATSPAVGTLRRRGPSK